MENNIQLGHLKKDAQIVLTFGGAIIGHIQEALLHLTKSLTTEEMSTLRGKVERSETLTEQENVIVVLSTIMLAISKEAERTSQIVQQDIQTTFGI